MLNPLLMFATLYFAGLLVFVGAVRRAPHGFEDDQGFHEGRHHDE